MEESHYETDMVIIGAGPVGIFASFQAGLLGIKCHLLDNLDRPGGQCTQLYPEKPIYDIPARPSVTGQKLIDDLLEQAGPFDPQFHFNQQAQSLLRLDDGRWQVSTSHGVVVRAAAVVIAAGAGSFVPKRPAIKNIEDFEDKSVFYEVHRMADFKDKNVVIVGGGDSALDWVLSLTPIAKRVMLVHRRPDFRAAPDSVDKMFDLLNAGKIDFTVGTVQEIQGQDGIIDQLQIQTAEGDNITHTCDVLMPFFGLKVSLGPIAEWGLNLERNHIHVDAATHETGIEGLYSIGDICTYPGKIKLILTGFHEAATMAHTAFSYIFPNEKKASGYSSTSSELQSRLGVK
ncbi:MAG: ferredoxin--NADP(+) reductase [Kordiimonas sp.]|nr:ferredoxin--NADP(+) reductase [Kordiimonas sp.]|tara:strand:- start:161 stop:1192 length:1032 start_codon:yes stop_codon:yes gene_type:complete